MEYTSLVAREFELFLTWSPMFFLSLAPLPLLFVFNISHSPRCCITCYSTQFVSSFSMNKTWLHQTELTLYFHQSTIIFLYEAKLQSSFSYSCRLNYLCTDIFKLCCSGNVKIKKDKRTNSGFYEIGMHGLMNCRLLHK